MLKNILKHQNKSYLYVINRFNYNKNKLRNKILL